MTNRRNFFSSFVAGLAALCLDVDTFKAPRRKADWSEAVALGTRDYVSPVDFLKAKNLVVEVQDQAPARLRF